MMKLALFVIGQTQKARAAESNLRRVLDRVSADTYELDVIDVLEEPQSAEDANIMVTPTLLKTSPKPICRIVGDLSQTKAVLLGLGLDDPDDHDAHDSHHEERGQGNED